MTSKVEQVSRAICEADPLAPSPDAAILWGKKQCRRAWEARVPMALAAIEAMLEPSEAMVNAGKFMWDGQEMSAGEVRAFWNAMLTAALEEE